MTGATPKGVGPSQAEPVPVSSLRASVPSAADQCTMGVGCDQYGVCYADAHGEPEQCPRRGRMSDPEQIAMARQVVGRFYQGIRDHDYAKWVFDGHKDGTTGVQIALAAITACAQAIEARRAETLGSACESAVTAGHAPDTPDLSTPLPSGSIER